MKLCTALGTNGVFLPEDFITEYMPSASGAYLKVYLYMLLKGDSDICRIAEDLELTEGDVKRAIEYWKKKMPENSIKTEQKEKPVKDSETGKTVERSGNDGLREKYAGTGAAERYAALRDDADFQELLIIVQTYRSKIMDEREIQVIAYLYDGLGLGCEVIDYLVSYAVEKNHNDIRYIETVGKDWAAKGIHTAAEAQAYTKSFEAKPQKTAGKKQAAGTGRGNTSRRGTDYDALVEKELIEMIGN